MKILITGISGLVGSFIAKKLVKEGHTVTGLVREDSDLSLIEGILNKINLAIGDILDIPNLEKAITGQELVVHSAGLVSFLPKDSDRLFKINVEGTANVVNICLANNIKKLLFISSVAAIGRNEKLKNIDFEYVSEATEWLESPNNSNYAKSKYVAELEVWRGISEGLPAVILNPSNILGEADWTKSSTKLFKYVFDQNIFYTNGNLNYIDIEDLTDIACQLLLSDIENERYIVSAGSLPQIDFFTKIGFYFKKNPPKYKLGNLAVSILWRLEALKAVLTGTDPLITKETAKSAKTHIIYVNEKVKNELKFEFKSIENSLERICKALIEKHNKGLEKQ
jgi:dihydroflavonol-4-reductase